MKDLCTYRIKLRGFVTGDDVNAGGPIRMTVEQVEADGTLLTFCSDQSGLIGIMRYIHGLGFILLSVDREDRVESAYQE